MAVKTERDHAGLAGVSDNKQLTAQKLTNQQ